MVQLAQILQSEVRFPEPFDVSMPIDPDVPIDLVADEVEAAAARQALVGSTLNPLGSGVVEVLEAGGVTVVRDPETNRDIDAYSAIVDELPIIVLDGGHGSVWDRDNFNLAHELGHLVMHRGIDHQPGTRSVEDQATCRPCLAGLPESQTPMGTLHGCSRSPSEGSWCHR